jgi:hypothetical protein
MKVLAQIPHPEYSVTLYAWNQKYILKFEQDNLEQTYKIGFLDVSGEEDVKQVLQNQDFMQKVALRFEAMRYEWYEVLEMY